MFRRYDDSRDLFWHYPHYGNQGGEPSAIILRGNWKLIHYFEDDRHELYDIGKDIGETKDLAADQADTVAKLAAALEAWQKEVGASFPTRKPDYNEANFDKSMQQLKNTGLSRREQQHAAVLDPNFKPRGGWWDQRGK